MKKIQISINDSEKSSESKFNKRSYQQNRRKLNLLPFMKKDVCARHSMTAQDLQETFRVQKKFVDFAVVQAVFLNEQIIDELFSLSITSE